MRRPFRNLVATALLMGLLGCGGDSEPAAPAYSLEIQPGDISIPPSGGYIAYVATLRQNGQPLAYPAIPQWSFMNVPSYSVGTLTPLPDTFGTPDPAKRWCMYQAPSALPQGVDRITFKVRVLVQVGGQNVEASRNLTLDVNAPPWSLPEEDAASRKDADH